MTSASKPSSAVIRSTSPWRWFPAGLFLSMAAVFAVNAVLVWQALDSFPGKAVENDFDTSNNYNQVLDAAQAQAALGWKLEARADAGHSPPRTCRVRRCADDLPPRPGLTPGQSRRRCLRVRIAIRRANGS